MFTLRHHCALALLLCAGPTLQANPITKAEARLVAQELVGISDTSSDDVPQAPYYIFSRGGGRGFVIASGDDSTAPILGYTEQGDYDTDSLPPQLLSMLNLWNDRIGEVQRRPQTQRQTLSAPRRAVADYKKEWASVTPLLNTHWHQSAPYNNLAPIKEGVGRCMTGCVATAGSQLTYYFHKDNPTELAYDTPTYSYGTPVTVSLPKGTPIEWDLMKLSGTGTARQDSAVAKLMYALGTSAWLTYGDGDGLATSGHNNKMAEAMKGQFGLDYSYSSKSAYSQQKWEELIYKNLSEKRPMLYSGVHPTNGGHSVCLDGYQAATGLYHFNFGWGGQGDGYYTVDDETGMNGFSTYQDLVCNVTPQTPNIEAATNSTTLYHKAANNVLVTVTNNGTLDYKNIYIYLGKLQDKVTTSAVGYDTQTVIETGASETLAFTVTPAATDFKFMQICGKNRKLIASIPIEIVSTSADLTLDAIDVDGSTETTVVEGMAFRHVNNTAATVTATLTNGEAGTFCQPSLKCMLQRYDTATKSWSSVTSMVTDGCTFGTGETQKVEFVFTGLTDGVCYRAYLDSKATASTQTDIAHATADAGVRFTVFKPDLAVTADGRTATVTGRWNATLFAEMATDANVTSYDITAVTELGEKPQAPNPNALFYTNAGDTALAAMDNVVAGDECRRLVVSMGADFMPMRPFTAREAMMVLTDAAPGKWHAALIPFAADVPYGMQMKQAKEYVSTGTPTVNHEATRHVEAMTVATYLTSRDGLNTLTATDAAVGTDTVATLFDGLLQAATLGTPLQEGTLVPGEYAASLYFVAPPAGQTVVDAFLPVVKGAAAQRVRTTSETLVDGYYRSLSTTINQACDTLDAHPRKAQTAAKALKDEIAAAQDMLTYRTHKENADVKNEREALSKAIRAFLEADDEETADGDVNGDSVVDVADIAAIISVMAGTETQPTAAGRADVNGDGAVDVADIAHVISLMAAMP